MSSRMLLGGHITHNAKRFPDKVALIDSAGRTTYAEFEAGANQIGHALIAAGVGHGDKVAFLACSSRRWVEAFYGVVKIGAVAVPLNYRETPEQISMMLEDSGAKVLFVSNHHIETFGALIEGLSFPVVMLESLHSFKVASSELAHSDDALSEHDPAVILYTGGTTGRSKGVLLTHSNLFWNSLNEIIDTDMCEGDNTLIATPLHHSAALNCWLLPHLYLGATATLLEKYATEDVLRVIAKERVTNTFMPPSLAREFVLHPLTKTLDVSSMTRWYVGSGILTANDRSAMKTCIPGVKIFYQYGLTEAGPIATVLKEEDYQRAPDSIGRAFQNVEVAIMDDQGVMAPAGVIGEIVLRGPTIMLGYHNRPDATRDAIDDKGWLHTGDLAHMDSNGFVFFYDRLKDMIKTGGLNVYSQEVEAVLSKHKHVREVAVIGLNNERWGEEVTAIVVLHDGVESSAEVLVGHAREHLASYQLPKRVEFIAYEDMPFNHNGKILKRELRKRFEPLN
ncbi:long-chain fatty acid--CoA ligase [Pseudomonas fragi]|uniref:class I adenylate-forming enzyme family protein n=1 Tax=Pseudomonas fragi TaxID=296 RepID=UPI0014736F84|nr:AMP-binding protein [Pseudomonas fragi]NNB05528.1 long-chain fatty acid--CoA ligase [Pseudomonas fragi]